MNSCKRLISGIMFLLLAALSRGGMAFAAGPSDVWDIGAAREICDRTPLTRIEGIWEFPDDHTRVLILRRERVDMEYDVIVAETPDCRLHPGDVIGTVKDSADPKKFELNLYRTGGAGKFADMGKCMARLASDGNSITVSASRMKATIRSLSALSFLPKFWRAIRLSTSRPADELPKGLVRIYPEESLQRDPIYL